MTDKPKSPPPGDVMRRAPTERIAGAISKPTPAILAELEGYRKRLVKAINPTTHERFVLTYKCLAHALLYRAQHHGIPSSELRQFLRSLIPMYLPHGSKLSMHPELKDKLETGAGMPQWPSAEDRREMDRILSRIYEATDTCPVAMQIRIYWHLLMLNAERLGMTHEAVLLRLEVLDRMQRAEGPASRYMPKRPPSWVKAK